MLSLHNLEKDNSVKRNRKRRGRGNASGKGNYSTRGMKGQRSRSGGKSGLSLRSMKSYLLRIPKVRGFQSLNTKMAVVNIEDLDNNFKDGNTINARALHKLGLISTIKHGVKILGNGKLNKKLTVEANAFSKTAEETIKKAGGQVKVVGFSKKEEKKDNKQEDKK